MTFTKQRREREREESFKYTIEEHGVEKIIEMKRLNLHQFDECEENDSSLIKFDIP